MPDYQIKISGRSDHHGLQNLSSNPTANFSESDNNTFNCQILNPIQSRKRSLFDNNDQSYVQLSSWLSKWMEAAAMLQLDNPLADVYA
jgi:hypothetical protein